MNQDNRNFPTTDYNHNTYYPHGYNGQNNPSNYGQNIEGFAGDTNNPMYCGPASSSMSDQPVRKCSTIMAGGDHPMRKCSTVVAPAMSNPRKCSTVVGPNNDMMAMRKCSSVVAPGEELRKRSQMEMIQRKNSTIMGPGGFNVQNSGVTGGYSNPQSQNSSYSNSQAQNASYSNPQAQNASYSNPQAQNSSYITMDNLIPATVKTKATVCQPHRIRATLPPATLKASVVKVQTRATVTHQRHPEATIIPLEVQQATLKLIRAIIVKIRPVVATVARLMDLPTTVLPTTVTRRQALQTTIAHQIRQQGPLATVIHRADFRMLSVAHKPKLCPIQTTVVL
ncbi:unnamed protein product [Bursaphelenchus xylophilus]|uniref:(pine wood nematode) hypothetical protein n=1 Tax=Bursaphelenchus xylophilus TaxID=6326 RepID=A0A1I7S8H9_BURXY|nr:unnamed protein product [Bursaphelenchus xylophilus]CAG9121105.1 unnamed protein product [Bursaphelenchus xylophilus]